MKAPQQIIISRTDSIGDVVLTLPMAGELRKRFPGTRIIFLGRDYTRDVVALSEHVDDFISWDSIAKLDLDGQKEAFRDLGADTIIHVFPEKKIAELSSKSKIPKRIGTTGRIYHYRYCNHLVPFSRKRSDLHEAQLNFKLLKPVIGDFVPTLDEITANYGFTVQGKLAKKWEAMLDENRFNLILHPKSKGSAREWPLQNYSSLIRMLPADRFKIFISGTGEESSLMKQFLEEHEGGVTDLTGQLTLKEYINFISTADGLVAASTGPLHLAAALGKLAVGIYPPIKPMHPGRWAPIGRCAHFLVVDKACSDCRINQDCHCMAEVLPEKVAHLIQNNAG